MTDFRFVPPKSYVEAKNWFDGLEEIDIFNLTDKERRYVGLLLAKDEIENYQRWKWLAENKDDIDHTTMYIEDIGPCICQTILFMFKDGSAYQEHFDYITRRALKRKFRKFGIPYELLPTPSDFPGY